MTFASGQAAPMRSTLSSPDALSTTMSSNWSWGQLSCPHACRQAIVSSAPRKLTMTTETTGRYPVFTTSPPSSRSAIPPGHTTEARSARSSRGPVDRSVGVAEAHERQGARPLGDEEVAGRRAPVAARRAGAEGVAVVDQHEAGLEGPVAVPDLDVGASAFARSRPDPVTP